jgi:hypothetical protein
MRHIKIYEAFTDAEVSQLTTPEEKATNFEVESTDFKSLDDTEEGDYIVNFVNADGEETTMSIGHAIEPEYMGKKMISVIDMVPGSSSDGKEYSIIGYYDKSEDFRGAYNLEKVLIQG